MHLDKLFIYPIKSLPGIAVTQCQAGIRGLEGDRRYMLCDDSGKFISLRQHKSLYRFNVELNEEVLLISHPDASKEARVPMHPETGEGRSMRVAIWEDRVEGIEVLPEVSKWFSEILHRRCHLVYMPDASEREIKEKWQTGHDLVSFADGYSYLVVGDGSLTDISKKAGIAEDSRRFRPNIVISGVAAYDEMNWKSVQVGNAAFICLKPCERCIVTTIDPDTMEKGSEPLRTLAQQKVEDKLVFGMHASIRQKGMIEVGDDVEVLSRKEYPYQDI